MLGYVSHPFLDAYFETHMEVDRDNIMLLTAVTTWVSDCKARGFVLTAVTAWVYDCKTRGFDRTRAKHPFVASFQAQACSRSPQVP